MGKSYFEDIGIVGWERIEPIILGAMLTGKSVLLKGTHGANKTEGCARISAAVYGEDAKFVPYDTSLVNADDLLGFLNPASLSRGEIDYISTPDSIWDANCCLLDEINRCNPYNAAKFFEIVRARTINGRATKLQFVFAACNPPDRYNTAHMDPAQVSRFIVLDVPGFGELTPSNKRSILGNAPDNYAGLFQELMQAAESTLVPQAQLRAIDQVTLKLAEELNKQHEVHFSGRQVVDLRNLFAAMDKINQRFEQLEIDEAVLATAVMGLVPEATGLIRTNVSASELRGKVLTILKGFKLSDPVLTASSLKDLCGAQVRDVQGLVAGIADFLANTETREEIDDAWQVLGARQDLQPEIYNTLRHHFAARIVLLSAGKDDKIEAATPRIRSALQTLGARAVPRSNNDKRNKRTKRDKR